MVERLDLLSKRAEKLEERPHISIWRTGMLNPNGRYKPHMFYVSLDWHTQEEGQNRPTHCQYFLTKHIPYPKAISEATRIGKELNLPVIKHANEGLVVLYKSNEPITEKQIKILAKILDFKNPAEYPSVSGEF